MFLVNETGAFEDCSTCKRKGSCENGNAYTETNPYRFKDFKEIAFDFCPFSLAKDTSFCIYFSQIWALQFGINSFGENLGCDELDALLILSQLKTKLMMRRYAEFWAQALGGKK